MIKLTKKLVAFLLMIVMIVTMLPYTQLEVKADTKSVSLRNLGSLGTVEYSAKKKDNVWWQMKIDGSEAFCLDLGKTCHTGYTYQSSSKKLSSDSSNTVDALKAKIGYWYDQTKGRETYAWVYAQALIWAVEEGDTSEASLKKIIGAVRTNTGYYNSKSANELYKEIFERKDTVTCTIYMWQYVGVTDEKYVQRLMQVKSSGNSPTTYIPHKISLEDWYRQEIKVLKKDEGGEPVQGVHFRVTAQNIDDMYSYDVGDESGLSGNKTEQFEAEFTTKKSGIQVIQFTYRIQSKDYYYYTDDDLKKMSSDDKKKEKEKLDRMGYEHPSNLTSDSAWEMAQKDLLNQMDKDENNYLIEEIGVEDGNVLLNADFEIKGSKDMQAKFVKLSDTKCLVSLKGGWWRKEDGTWEEQDAYRAELTAVNKIKKVKVNIQKKDADTGETVPSGDATFDGAEYRVWGIGYGYIYDAQGTNLGQSKTYTIKNGVLETDYLACGKTYYYQEVKAPEGYKLDADVHYFVVDGSEYDKEFNEKAEPIGESLELVDKGRISITKLESTGESGEIPPEKNAEFQVYLKRFGSYERAKETERDILKTDENGYAISKELPYGTYVVHQIKGDSGKDLAPDFEVECKKDGETYHYFLDNVSVTTYLKVTKKDSTTGKTVLKAGTTYQIYSIDKDGKETIVKQRHANGNKIEIVDQFVTDESGVIVTYEQLQIGKYRIKETKGVSGFHNKKQYVDIEITNFSYRIEKDDDNRLYKIAEVEYFNDETYGQLTVLKTGEILKDFTTTSSDNSEKFLLEGVLDELYPDDGILDMPGIDIVPKDFVYENSYIKGTTFEIFATEDIMTQDNQGTKWFNSGEKVATIITGEGAEFKQMCNGICTYSVDDVTGAVKVSLPLGKYVVKEIKTNYGYVLGEQAEWNVEFTWSSQDDEYVLDSSENTDKNGILKINNDRAKADLSIVKKDAKVDMGVKDTKFGFYTRNNIYSADGDIIAEAGELLTVVTTDEKGIAKVGLDLPIMSKGYDSEAEDNYGLNSGDYYFIEQYISDSYYIDKKEIPVHLEYADMNTPMIVAQAKQVNAQTEVEIDKIGIAGSEELNGCELVVTDEEGNQIIRWISGEKNSSKITDMAEQLGYANLKAEFDEKGHIIVRGLMHDKQYTLTEIRPADGYITAGSICFLLAQDKQKEEAVTTKVFIKDEAGAFAPAAENKVIMKDDITKIRFNKLGSDTTKLIAGAKYKVLDSTGNVIYEFVTNQENAIIIEGLLKVNETYTFVEIEAPENYEKAEDVTLTVKDTGEIQEITVVDKYKQRKKLTKTSVKTTSTKHATKAPDKTKKREVTLKSPKTGVKEFPYMVSSLMCFILFAGLVILRVAIKKLKNEKS